MVFMFKFYPSSQELANQLVEMQDIPLQLNLLGILVRILPLRLQDLNQFAKQLFSGTLVAPFLRVAPERFVSSAREFISALQTTKPDALLDRNSNSTVTQWLDSVESDHTPELEPVGCMEASVRSASKPLDSAPKNGRGAETFENEERLRHARTTAHAHSTPLSGALRLDSDLRQQFLSSLNLLGQTMFDQIEQRIQDSLMDKDSLSQRIERKVDEAVESRVREE
ncbi:hypothetical protein BGZ81_006961 [Podila clonocystis]|nr:hypothetical protein BGZ81_006961 [Podila clonocystis]